jgi:hypothetical protein
MLLNIKDPATEKSVRELAALTGRRLQPQSAELPKSGCSESDAIEGGAA